MEASDLLLEIRDLRSQDFLSNLGIPEEVLKFFDSLLFDIQLLVDTINFDILLLDFFVVLVFLKGEPVHGLEEFRLLFG